MLVYSHEDCHLGTPSMHVVLADDEMPNILLDVQNTNTLFEISLNIVSKPHVTAFSS